LIQENVTAPLQEILKKVLPHARLCVIKSSLSFPAPKAQANNIFIFAIKNNAAEPAAELLLKLKIQAYRYNNRLNFKLPVCLNISLEFANNKFAHIKFEKRKI
jgi:hypothetical protein